MIAEKFDDIYQQFAQKRWDYGGLVNSCQKIIMLVSMASEVAALGHRLDRISEGNRRYRDFTLNSLTFALREIIAALYIYRTYINRLEAPSLRDRLFIEEAVQNAKAMNPRTAVAVFDFIRDTLLLRNLEDFDEQDRPRLIDWVMKFQQVTGPVLAKGLEDTAFYVYNRLVSLNEVGGHPEGFGVTVPEFHKQNELRQQRWPHAMLASSTHDTKRSEDVRARINVLSEIPDEWRAAIARWHQINKDYKTRVDNILAPDNNEEYLFYQTLIGAWPGGKMTREATAEFRGRVAGYMQKAIKEAKVHTSWVNPNSEYDAAVDGFVHALLPDGLNSPFIEDMRKLQQKVAYFGYINSLAQTLLKLTSPGVPDFYRGTELWDFSLVDPDNRRPVDFHLRHEILTELTGQIETGTKLGVLARELLDSIEDGRIKLYLIYRVLNFRRQRGSLFHRGGYLPLFARGSRSDHVCGFARALQNQEMVAVVPRLVYGLCDGKEQMPVGEAVWKDTWLPLPNQIRGRSFSDVLTGAKPTVEDENGQAGLRLSEVLRDLPVSLLVRD